MIDIAIRQMKESDLPFIRRGLTEIFLQDLSEDLKTFINAKAAEGRSNEGFDRCLRDEKLRLKVFVATSTHDEVSMGFVSVGELTNPEVEMKLGGILDFWVPEEFRIKGIGSKLLDYALDYIKRQGYFHASLMVSASNYNAIRMYEKREFKPDRINMTKKMQSGQSCPEVVRS